jgi:drug/metabolite transporter (DMT)-like permease
VGLAVTGVALLLAARGLDLSAGPLRGDLVILAAVAAWSAFTLLGKSILRRHGALTVIATAFAVAALAVLPLGPWILRGFDTRGPGLTGWLDLVYLGVVTSGVAFTLWYWALGRLEASQTAVFTNLQAPMTAILVWLVYGDTPGYGSLIGGALVIAGVSMTQRPVGFAGAARRRAPEAG